MHEYEQEQACTRELGNERLWGLVGQIQQGGPEGMQAFGDLYDTTSASVYYLVYRRVHHVQLAEDITSLTYLRALQASDKVERKGDGWVMGWLSIISLRLVIDHKKSSTYKNELLSRFEDTPTEEDDTPTSIYATQHDNEANSWLELTRENDVEATVENRVLRSILIDALRTLQSDKQRKVLVLRYIAGLSEREIANRLNVGVEAVKSTNGRGLRALRQIFSKRGITSMASFEAGVDDTADSIPNNLFPPTKSLIESYLDYKVNAAE